MIVRAASTADIPAIVAVFEAFGDDVTWPDIPGWPYVEHLVARARVAVASVDDEVIGFGGALDVGRPDIRFLTDLFVRPDRQDNRAGRALLAPLFEGTSERLTFSSADPRALGTYIRAGMRPWWPLLYLDVPRAAVGEDHGHLVAEPADVTATAALSLAWSGMDRTEDFTYYAGLPGGSGYVIRDPRGEAAAVVWAHRRRSVPGRVLAHAMLAPDVDPLAAGLAVLRAALAETADLIASVPGPHPVVPAILGRGARIKDHDTYCATDPAVLDPERIFPSPGFL